MIFVELIFQFNNFRKM